MYAACLPPPHTRPAPRAALQVFAVATLVPAVLVVANVASAGITITVAGLPPSIAYAYTFEQASPRTCRYLGSGDVSGTITSSVVYTHSDNYGYYSGEGQEMGLFVFPVSACMPGATILSDALPAVAVAFSTMRVVVSSACMYACMHAQGLHFLRMLAACMQMVAAGLWAR